MRPINFFNDKVLSKNNRKKEFWKSSHHSVNLICIGLNIQGLNPSPRSKSGWKIPRLREEIDFLKENNFSIPFIAIVESWLKPETNDAQINIDGFKIF